MRTYIKEQACPFRFYSGILVIPDSRWALAETGDRPIVEVSTRDPWWGARPVADRYEGHNVLGRLWMELRHHIREDDPAAPSGAWTGRIRVGCLADGAPLAKAAPQSA